MIVMCFMPYPNRLATKVLISCEEPLIVCKKKNIPPYVTSAPTRERKVWIPLLQKILKTNNARIGIGRKSTPCLRGGLTFEAKFSATCSTRTENVKILMTSQNLLFPSNQF